MKTLNKLILWNWGDELPDAIPTQNPQTVKQIYRGAVLGYTLIEVLIAVTISFVGIFGGLMLYRTGHRAVNVVTASSEMHQGVRKALETMTREIQATAVDTIDLSESNAISFASAWQGNTFTTNTDGTPDWQNAVVYFWDSETSMLYRYVEAKDDWSTNFDTESAFEAENLQSLVPSVTNLEFALDDNLLEITIGISKNLQSVDMATPVTTELTTQVWLRN